MFRATLHAGGDCVTLACMSQARETLEQVFREEYGRIIATLIRISGSFDLAEEALQEAFASAASKWELEGPPNNPGAWLTTVAHRRLLDAIRRDRTRSCPAALAARSSPSLPHPIWWCSSTASVLSRSASCCPSRFNSEARAGYS